MRTKTLLAAAATLAVSLATSMAQVYSQNIVGYINLTVKPGFNLVANQLASLSGSNTISEIFPSVKDGTLIYKFNPVSGAFTVDYFNVTDITIPLGWSDSVSGNPSTTTLSPGEGFFISSSSPTNDIVTLVGNVKTGTNTVHLVSGFNLLATVVPTSYLLVPTNNFPAVDGMLYYAANPSGAYDVSYYNTTDITIPLGWSDSVSGNPVTIQPAVGQGFFISSPGISTWTNILNP